MMEDAFSFHTTIMPLAEEHSSPEPYMQLEQGYAIVSGSDHTEEFQTPLSHPFPQTVAFPLTDSHPPYYMYQPFMPE